MAKTVIRGRLMAVLLLAAVLGTGTADGRVVALLVVDTETRIAGLDVDHDGVRGALESGLNDGERLIFDDLSGPRVSRETILQRLREMPAGPGDTVFFYYSGHGAVLRGIDHALTTSGGDVLRSEVREALQAKGARLTVILTDCCANVVKRAPRPQAPMAAPGLPRQEIPPIRSLLLGHSGLVDILSSDVGESSWSNSEKGGFFTNALVRGLNSPFAHDFDLDGDGFVEWEEFFPYLKSRTMWLYREFRDDRLMAQSNDDRTVAALKQQPNQTPRYVSLGHRGEGAATGHYAANFGINYQVVPMGDRLGARLTRPPAPGSPAAAIQLEPGDLIYEIDGLPIRHFVDVLNHNSRTSVSFVNIRTSRPETRTTDLPPFTRYPPGVPAEHFTPNLGLYYQLVPFESAMGARLSRYPVAGSPFLAYHLEPGDMLFDLDDQPIRSPDDVTNHRWATTFRFVNIRSGLIQSGQVILP